MTTFISFVPRNEFEAGKQVKQFIAYCRDELTIFADKDPDFDWAAVTWNIAKTQPIAGNPNIAHGIPWTRWRGGAHKGQPMTQPFGDFARGYCRHTYGEESNPVTGAGGFANFNHSLTALRAIEQALIDESPDGKALVERTNEAVLDRAIELLNGHYKSPHSFCTSVGKIYRFLKRKKMVAHPEDWENPIKGNGPKDKTDKTIKENRNKKLPGRAAMLAMQDIFREAKEPRDIITSAVCWIIGSNPSRRAEMVDAKKILVDYRPQGDREELVLRWWPVKGGKPKIKAVPEAFTELVEEAVRRLLELSEEARAMAKWYETHPTELYLPLHLEHRRTQEWLTTDEACELIGITGRGLTKINDRAIKDDLPEPIPAYPASTSVGEGSGSGGHNKSKKE